ncbi:MAG: hypothetical protein GY851_35250 [bacterium]|nr:hypothetical protein [bacterium]
MNRIGLGMCLVVGLCAAWCGAVEIVNPGFSEGAEGWNLRVMKGTASHELAEEDGNPCLRLVSETASRIRLTQGVSIEPEGWYCLRFKYLAGPNGEGGGGMGHARIAITDAKGKFIDYATGMSLLDTFGEWRTAELVFKNPLCGVAATMEVNASGKGEVRLDDFVLDSIDAPSQPANTWTQFVEPRDGDPLTFSSWQYTHDAKHFRAMGMKYGWDYAYLDQFDELIASRTVPLWQGEKTFRIYAEKGIRGLVYLYYPALSYHKAHYNGAPPEDMPRIIDPVWHDGLVKGCRDACAKYGDSPGIEYVFVADEPFKEYTQAIIAKDKRVSLYWDELERVVRDEYGDGQFGLPEGPDDDNAFRWIAYLGWAGDHMTSTFARLRAVIDESACGAKLLGPDELGFACAQHWCDLGEYADVFTGQALAARGTGRAYRAGFITKCAADFTGKAVHNATQIPAYGGSPSPEWVQELYSQVLRNGGEGQMLIAVEWFDRDLNHHRYSAPERWATVKNYLNTMATTRVRIPYDAQVGVLFSTATARARGGQLADYPIMAAYAMCGPVTGAWPRMVESHAIRKGKTTLDGLSVLVLPEARYEDRAVFDAIVDFVREGGLLVCCEPDALAWGRNGEALPNQDLLGVTSGDSALHRTVSMTWPEPSVQRVHAEDAVALDPVGENVEVIGRYEDDTVAVTRHSLGKGSVIVFGAHPLTATSVAEDAEWAAWWRGVFAARDIPVDLPIWDLRLPDGGLVQAERPRDVCITGNNFVRCQNGVYLGANAAVEGTYTFSVAPDLSAESAGNGPVPFAAGDLTDRTTADDGPFTPRRRNSETPYEEADWANRWSAEALGDGLGITFSFPEARELTRVRFWYSGALPKLEIAGGGTVLADVDSSVVGTDVAVVDVPLSSACATVELRFASMAEGSLAIADIEVWARPVK